MTLNKTALILALASLLSVGTTAAQEAYPLRPVTIVVPYPAGGTSDVQIRMIQEPLSKELGQPIIIDNRPGASGALAAHFVAKAKPDGYTLLFPNNGVLIAPLLTETANYDALKDFKPVSLVSLVPMVLVSSKNVPAANLRDFLEYVKKQPHGVMYASAGTASYGHLASTRFAQMAGINLTHVPYKGEANTTMAVRTGEVQMLLTTPSANMLGQVKEGNLNLLGVATEQPSPVVPGAEPIVKTLPGFTSEVWFGLLAPAGTPDDVVQKLNAAVRKVIAPDEIRAKMLITGAVPTSSTPAEFASMMTSETAQWRDIIAKNHLQAD